MKEFADNEALYEKVFGTEKLPPMARMSETEKSYQISDYISMNNHHSDDTSRDKKDDIQLDDVAALLAE